MKKGLIFAVLALVVVAGGLWYWQQRPVDETPTAPATPVVSQPGLSAPAAIDFVPANTVIFFGSLEPTDLSEYVTNMQAYLGAVDMQTAQSEIARSFEQISGESHEASPGVRLLFGLYAEYLAEFLKPGGLVEMGLADPTDMAFYTQGALPVLRLRVGDGPAFDAFVTRAAARFQAKGETVESDGISYQRFALTPPAASKSAGLIIARHEGFGILTLDLGDLVPPETLELALGKTRPAQSLADSGHLEQIARTNGLLPTYLGFIDHLGLMRAVTRTDDPLAIFLDKLSQGKTAESLAPYREPACRQEMEAMAALWPRTLFGYTRLDLKSSPMVMDGLVKIETTDAPLMKSLMALRGFLPTFGDGTATRVALKLGVNIDKLVPTLSSLWTRATSASFTCQPLVAAQEGLRQANPALLGAMTGMAQGLRGVSLAIQDLTLKSGATGTPELGSLDGLVSVSAENPEQLWGFLGAVNPSLATLPLPEDGQATDLPLALDQLPDGVKLGRYGSHLVVFSGAKGAAAAKSLADQPLVTNGLYESRLDYGLFADLFAMLPDSALVAAAQAAGAPAGPENAEAASQSNDESVESDTASAAAAPEPTPAAARELARMRNQFERMRGLVIDMKLDFVPDGVTLGSHIEIQKGA